MLITTACGGDDSEDADDPPATRDSTTTVQETTTTTSSEDAVREAYSSYVAMIDRITTTTVDPNDPELVLRMIDPALSEARTLLSTWQAQGQVWLAGDQDSHHVETVVVDRDRLSAVVTDCTVANDVLVAAGTTDAQLPAPTTARVTTTMVTQDGTWRAQDSQEVQRWDGVAGCAA